MRGKKGLSYSNKRVTIQCVVVDTCILEIVKTNNIIDTHEAKTILGQIPTSAVTFILFESETGCSGGRWPQNVLRLLNFQIMQHDVDAILNKLVAL